MIRVLTRDLHMIRPTINGWRNWIGTLVMYINYLLLITDWMQKKISLHTPALLAAVAPILPLCNFKIPVMRLSTSLTHLAQN